MFEILVSGTKDTTKTSRHLFTLGFSEMYCYPDTIIRTNQPNFIQILKIMLEQCMFFLKTGIVLWQRSSEELIGHPVNTLIETILLEDRIGESKAIVGNYVIHWSLDNAHDLILVIVSQKSLALDYIEPLLYALQTSFLKTFITSKEILCHSPVDFGKDYTRILARITSEALSKNKKTIGLVGDNGTINNDDITTPMVMTSKKKKVMKTGPRVKKNKDLKKKTNDIPNTLESTKSKKKKTMQWNPSKLSSTEKKALDRSTHGMTEEARSAQIEEMRQQYIGKEEMDKEEDYISSSEESNSSFGHPSDSESDSSSTSWGFGKRVGNFFHSISGNKVK